MNAIAAAAVVLFSVVSGANAMTFTLRGQTVYASGPIVEGDAARVAGLPRFDALELETPRWFGRRGFEDNRKHGCSRWHTHRGQSGLILRFSVRHGAVCVR